MQCDREVALLALKQSIEMSGEPLQRELNSLKVTLSDFAKLVIPFCCFVFITLNYGTSQLLNNYKLFDLGYFGKIYFYQLK